MTTTTRKGAPKKKVKTDHHVSFLVDEDTYLRLKRHSAKSGRTVSGEVRFILAAYLKGKR